ncbi:hypothetical protein [Paenibacillus dendritiformis]|uniref:hypothetical protein n=1 Tax=Paenibacillus dendritiformis TaxID=130049 RepID=UPI00387E12A9
MKENKVYIGLDDSGNILEFVKVLSGEKLIGLPGYALHIREIRLKGDDKSNDSNDRITSKVNKYE